MGVGGAELAHRADEHTDELTVAAAAHDQEACSFGCFDQDRRRMALLDSGRDLDARRRRPAYFRRGRSRTGTARPSHRKRANPRSSRSRGMRWSRRPAGPPTPEPRWMRASHRCPRRSALASPPVLLCCWYRGSWSPYPLRRVDLSDPVADPLLASSRSHQAGGEPGSPLRYPAQGCHLRTCCRKPNPDAGTGGGHGARPGPCPGLRSGEAACLLDSVLPQEGQSEDGGVPDEDEPIDPAESLTREELEGEERVMEGRKNLCR